MLRSRQAYDPLSISRCQRPRAHPQRCSSFAEAYTTCPRVCREDGHRYHGLDHPLRDLGDDENDSKSAPNDSEQEAIVNADWIGLPRGLPDANGNNADEGDGLSFLPVDQNADWGSKVGLYSHPIWD